MKLSHLFLPHPETHKKAHLLSTHALLIYIVFFLVINLVFSYLPKHNPGVLGIVSGLDQQELIKLTNKEREKNGLSPLMEDSRLNEAAVNKAKNMFEENYWAHYSPTNKTPWDFIQGAGYKFSYAGENLARNFYSSDEVVKAWMASPTHKDNIVNDNYTNIGIAVVEGVLNGQKTVLVVQEFGKPVQGLAQAPPSTDQARSLALEPQQSENTSESVPPLTLIANSNIAQTRGESALGNITIDPFIITKTAGIGVIVFLTGLILIDLYIIRRRMIYRVATRHLPQMGVMSVAATALWNSSAGEVTKSAVTMSLGVGP